MNGYLTYESNQARLSDMHRRAAEARRARGTGARADRRPLLRSARVALGGRRGPRTARPARA